jgi:hypothetical protein
VEGICIGFAPGSSALLPDGTNLMKNQNFAPVGSLVNEADPDGWHPLGVQPSPTMRRARRLDIWAENGMLHADLGFQDSGTHPDGGRVAVHEYVVTATIEPATMTLVALSADPRILPYRECPGATANIARVIGLPIASMRVSVPEILSGTLGCTHLNDVLRSLSDVAVLAEPLA